MDNNVSEKLVTFIKNPHGVYRGFLNGIADQRREKRYLLNLPTPKHMLRTVTKYDRTSKSKDVLFEAKDKRIAKLEEENVRLRKELDNLRRLLYEKK